MSFAMKWKKLIASDITLATSWKGQLKLIFWMDGTVVEEPPNSPSGPRRECAAQAVFAAGENLGAGAALPPRAWKSRRVEPPFGLRNPK